MCFNNISVSVLLFYTYIFLICQIYIMLLTIIVNIFVDLRNMEFENIELNNVKIIVSLYNISFIYYI
jgi:hypothetical protein